MNTYNPYSVETGLFTGVQIECPDSQVDANTPEGHSCLIGEFDYLSQRVNVGTGEVVDYQPPAPSDDHAWDAGIKRWVYVVPAAQVCAENRRAAYPPLADLADALYWKEQGDPTKMAAYLAACTAVKKTYPKPSV
jgi:hypothetical protein